MYASVLEKFVEVGVDMLPTLDSITESQETLKVGILSVPPCKSKSLTSSLYEHPSSTWLTTAKQELPLHCANEKMEIC